MIEKTFAKLIRRSDAERAFCCSEWLRLEMKFDAEGIESWLDNVLAIICVGLYPRRLMLLR